MALKDSKISIKLQFKDSEEPILLRDKSLLAFLPLVVRAVSSETADQENLDVIVSQPLKIPFQRVSGEFVLKTVRVYLDPKENNKANDVRMYPETRGKVLEELRDIIELGCFLECEAFVSCIGMVIADRLRDMDVEEVAHYLGLEKETGHVAEEEEANAEWLHPPLAALKAQRN